MEKSCIQTYDQPVSKNNFPKIFFVCQLLPARFVDGGKEILALAAWESYPGVELCQIF